MLEKRLRTSLFKEFSCTGDKCPLTCCVTEWGISITDEEIEKYKKLDHPFKEEILEAINFEKKCFKGDENNRCKLLTPEGLCKIVQNVGPKELTFTCKYFPREMYVKGDIFEISVEPVCPVVAEKMFENRLLEFIYSEGEIDVREEQPDSYAEYDSLVIARNFLINLFMSGTNEDVYGKIFLFLDLVFAIKKLIEENKLTPENVDELCRGYDNEELVAQVCETMRTTQYSKTYDENNMLRMFGFYRELFNSLMIRLSISFKDIEINKYISDFALLADSVNRLVKVCRENYGIFFRNFLINQIFLFFIPKEKEKFGDRILNLVNELFLIQLFSAMYFDQNGGITPSEYALIVTKVERLTSHSTLVVKQFKKINESLTVKEFMDMILF